LFADDTGLEVEALNGAPGVFSARYAGEQRSAADNMDKLLQVLSNQSNRNAQFKTVVTLNLNGKQYLFTGIARGEITLSKVGKEGFGYDPIFQPEGYQQTFAELSSELKNQPQGKGNTTTHQLLKTRSKLSNLNEKFTILIVINFSNTVPTALNLKLKNLTF
jgi:XTP/dITP diphosphohydrolase